MANFKKYKTLGRDENGNKVESITLINMDNVISCRVSKRKYDGVEIKVVRISCIKCMADTGYFEILVPEELQGDLVPDGIVLDKVLGL